MVIRLAPPLIGTEKATTERVIDKQQLWWLMLLTGAYLLRDIAALPMPDIVFTGMCGMAFLFLGAGSAMGVYMFTTALSVPDFEIRIVYLVVLLAKFWLQNKKIKASMLMIIFAMALLELVNMSLFSDYNVVGVIYTVAMRLTYFVLPLFWFSEDYSPEEYRRALLCYIAGVLLGGGVVLYMSVKAVGWQVLLEGSEVRLGLHTTDGYVTQSQIRTSYNANQLGGMFVIVIAIAIAMMDQKHMTKLWSMVLAVFSVFMVFLTKSRAAILLVLGIVVIYYFMLVFRRKKILSGIVFLAMVIALGYGIMEWFPRVVDDLLARFQESDNLTGGRSELFALYMNEWFDNIWVFLFGYGIATYPIMVDFFNVSHNILADIVISWGLTGLLCVIVFLGALCRRTAESVRRNIRLVAFLPAVVAFIDACAGQYLSTGYPHMRQCFLILAATAFAEYTQRNDVSVGHR